MSLQYPICVCQTHMLVAVLDQAATSGLNGPVRRVHIESAAVHSLAHRKVAVLCCRLGLCAMGFWDCAVPHLCCINCV